LNRKRFRWDIPDLIFPTDYFFCNCLQLLKFPQGLFRSISLNTRWYLGGQTSYCWNNWDGASFRCWWNIFLSRNVLVIPFAANLKHISNYTLLLSFIWLSGCTALLLFKLMTKKRLFNFSIIDRNLEYSNCYDCNYTVNIPLQNVDFWISNS
jgi:hypothetical protein